MRISPIILFLLLLSPGLHAQVDTAATKDAVPSGLVDTLPGNYYQLHTTDRDGVVLPEIELKEVYIVGREKTSRKFPFHRYQRLIYNLKKVYPYALVVRSKIIEINDSLELIPDDKDRRKYLRNIEKDIFGEYEDDVRNMTITQGRLLIKLIDRETRNTSYELIRQYRGSFSASFWQAVARIFGSNLKAEYDPYGEDFIIELIINEIDAGRL